MHVTGLPFSFSIAGDPSLAAPATFNVELGPAVAVEAFDRLRCVVAWFANLADAGALGGEHLSPLDGVGTLLNGAEPVSSGSLYHWQLLAWTFNARSSRRRMARSPRSFSATSFRPATASCPFRSMTHAPAAT